MSTMIANYMSAKEAAEFIGVTDARIRQLILTGELPAEKAGPVWMILKSEAKKIADRERKGGRPRISDSRG